MPARTRTVPVRTATAVTSVCAEKRKLRTERKEGAESSLFCYGYSRNVTGISIHPTAAKRLANARVWFQRGNARAKALRM